MARGKGDDAQTKQERVNLTYSLMLVGKRNKEISEYLIKKYNICIKTAYNYINAAQELKDEEAQNYRQIAYAEQISHLRNLYQKNYKIQDFKECRAIMADMRNLFGLDAPKKQELEVKTVEVDFTE